MIINDMRGVGTRTSLNLTLYMKYHRPSLKKKTSQRSDGVGSEKGGEQTSGFQ